MRAALSAVAFTWPSQQLYRTFCSVLPDSSRRPTEPSVISALAHCASLRLQARYANPHQLSDMCTILTGEGCPACCFSSANCDDFRIAIFLAIPFLHGCLLTVRCLRFAGQRQSECYGKLGHIRHRRERYRPGCSHGDGVCVQRIFLDLQSVVSIGP